MTSSTSVPEQDLNQDIPGVLPPETSDITTIEGWKFRMSSIPPGTGEMDVALGNKKYTIYRPDSRRIQVVVGGELITFDSVESMYKALSEKIENTPVPTNVEGTNPEVTDTPPQSNRDIILAIPRGQGKGGVIIDGVSYTIQRKSFGEGIDVIIDKKFYAFASIDEFLSSIGNKKEEQKETAPEGAPEIEEKIPENLRDPKRGDIIEYGGKSYRYIGMGERWQVQEPDARWNQIDYVTGPYITQKEMVELFLRATVESVKSKVKNVGKDEEKSDIDKLIQAFETQIQMAQDLVNSGVDNNNNELSLADKKGIEGTIEKMENEVKRLKAERAKKSESGNGSKETSGSFPLGIPTTKGEVVPYNPNRGNEWKKLGGKEIDTDKEGDVPKEGEKEPNVTPDYGFIAKSRGVRSNISDVSVNLESIAYSRAEERIRTEYADSGFFGKAKQFFTRAQLLEKYKKEELEKLRSESIFDAGTAHIRRNASDRFAKSNAITGIDSVKEIAKLEIPELNALATEFVQGLISEAQFQAEFEDLMKSNEALKKSLEGVKNGGTNIIKYLNGEKQFLQILRDLPSDEASIRAHLDIYIRSNPNIRKILEGALGLNLDERMDQVVFLLTKNEVREALRTQNLEVSLSVLTGGDAAFAIETGEKTDSRTYKVGKWLQKHPILSSVGTALGITASSLAAGPIGNIISGSLGIGGINGLRRGAEYSDEHTGFEKRITQGTHLESDIYTTIERLRSELSNASGLKKRWIEFRLRRAEEKLKLYQTQGIPAKELKNGDIIEGRIGTTHRHFAPIGSLNRKLYAYITQREGFELTGEKAEKNKQYLKLWILQGLTRIDLWKSSGHNFLKSRNEESMEADYNILYENLLLAQEKIGGTFEELRASSEYKELLTALEDDYKRAEKSFTSTRTSTALKQGVLHGAIYGTSSMVFQWLAGTGLFDSTKIVPGSPTVASGVVVDPGIADDLRRTLGREQYDAFVAHLSTATNPETLWDTLVEDIFNNKSVGNDVKNQIMTFILNATDVQNGVVKPELLIEAAKQGLFTDVANNSQNIDHVVGLLKQWGYGSVDKTWLIDTLRGIDAGTIQASGLSPMEQTKVSEALWCYVHRDGISAGSHLWEVFMDKVSVPSKMPDTTIVEKGGEWLRYIGIPTWKNTFLSRLRTDIVDSSGKPIQMPKGNDIGFDDGWKEKYGYDQEKKRFEEKREKKKEASGEEEPFRVVTRGDKKEIDSKDVNPDYPVPIVEKSEEEVINYMIDSAPAFFGDDYKYVSLWKANKIQKDQLVWLLKLSIERQRKEFEKNMGIYEEVLQSAHSLVQNIFQKYELDQGRLLTYEAFRKKARFYSFYEFMANFGSMNSSEAFSIKGYNRMTSGEIAFNMHGLTQKPMQSQILYIKHVAVHELLHGTAVNNYWETTDTDGSQDYMHRRSGMLQVNGNMKERGRALNEGIVETLSFSAMVSLFGGGYSSSGNIFYQDERKVIAKLVEKYSIDESLFVRAAYTRDGMRNLARALEGENRKGFLSLIIALMDRSTADTVRFLDGQKFQILEQEYAKVFPASLLENGKLGKKLREYISADASGISLKRKNEGGQISE